MALARIAASAAGVCVLASVASAAPINLEMESSPDITTSEVRVNYQPATSTMRLVADAAPMRMFDGTETYDVHAGVFEAVLTLDASGIASDGYFSVTGGVVDGNRATGDIGSPVMLLEGTFTQFGYALDSTTLEFVFEVKGGALLPRFNGFAGVLLTNSGYDNDWTQPWEWGNGFASIAPPLPTPGVLVSLAIAVGAVSSRRRR